MDDVFIQVLLHRPRIHIAELMKKAQHQIQSMDPISDGDLYRQRSLQVTTSLLEEELILALKAIPQESKPTFPLANAVGRATLSAAIRLATTATLGAQVLLEATKEISEGGESY